MTDFHYPLSDTVTLTSSHGFLCLLQSDACYYLAVNAVTGVSVEVTMARAMRLYYPVRPS